MDTYVIMCWTLSCCGEPSKAPYLYHVYIVGLSVYSAGYKGDRTQVMDGTVPRVLSQSIRYGGRGGRGGIREGGGMCWVGGRWDVRGGRGR